jgi:SH3-like domain-containing protein
VFKRAGAPVLVIAESVDHWRKIRDSSGDACWAHETTLKAQSHVLVLAAAELRRKPDETAAVSGRLGEGVFARIVSRRDGWILVTADDARGWIASNAVWGGEIAGRPAWRN